MPEGQLEIEGDSLTDSVTPDPSVWEFDLHPPPMRTGVILRRELLDRMSATDADVIVLVAPAGYGKTTLVTQWAQAAKGGVAWLTLSQSDNDARTLLSRLSASLARAGAVLPSNVQWIHSAADSPLTEIDNGRLISTLSKVSRPFGLVLDNAQVIRSRASLAVVAELVRQVEGHVKVVVTSRSDPKLGLATLRTRGRLMELDENDLAMSEAEVTRVLDGLGRDPQLTASHITSVTGGWPGAVILLIAANAVGNPEETSIEQGAGHRFLSQFIRQEVLPQLSKTRRDFLRLVSPLEHVSGPIAEAVTGGSGMSRFLPDLAASTHLVYPVEGPGDWYVMNRVLRRLLRADLENADPSLAASVHAAAANWYESNGMLLESIGHAQRAGNSELFVRLLSRLMKGHYATGYRAEVLLWLDWLQLNTPLAENTELAAVGALVHAMEGNTLETEKWLEAAAQGSKSAHPDSVTLMVRAAAVRSGLDTMIEDIEHAERRAAPGSEWMPAILLVKGIAHVLEGRPELAEPCFIQSCTTGVENHSWAAVILALGERAQIAIDRQDWDLATSLTEQALAIIDEHGHDGYHTSGLALTVAARCARRSNDITKTQTLLARASLVRPRLSAALPAESVQTLIAMAKTYIELSDVVGARALIREADDIVMQRPDLGLLPGQLDELRASLTSLGPGTVGLSALTKAELRLLPLLATNLSFPEIGEQLFISRHTVKTQAMSIYRKLATSSRSDAVAKAYETGLLQR